MTEKVQKTLQEMMGAMQGWSSSNQKKNDDAVEGEVIEG
jgi:hypothetical protein